MTPDMNGSNGAALALVNETTGGVLAQNLTRHETLFSKFMGLMGRTKFSGDAAAGLQGCDWVHTFLVKFPIDIAYCDRAGTVLKVVANMPPNRFAARAPGAFWAYEMRSGQLAPNVSIGDRLSAVPTKFRADLSALDSMTPGGA